MLSTIMIPGKSPVPIFLMLLFLCFVSLWRPEDTAGNPSESPSEPITAHETIPMGLQKLLQAYTDFMDSVEYNALVWKDGTRMIFDDGFADKDFGTLLNAPDLEDQFRMDYPKGRKYCIPERNSDPGRIRYEPFFRKMYGATPEQVRKNLVPVRWLPSTVNKTIMITSVNGVNEKLQAVSEELDAMPYLHRYINNPGITFNWRPIMGTKRQSSHSFGIAIDINVENANYWRWVDPREERFYLGYVNRIPIEIVEVFEKHGFIWGGKWYHYDTMHFEYRPELLINGHED